MASQPSSNIQYPIKRHFNLLSYSPLPPAPAKLFLVLIWQNTRTGILLLPTEIISNYNFKNTLV